MEPVAAGAAILAGVAGAAALKGKGRLGAAIAALGFCAGALYNFGYDALVFSHAEKLDGRTLTFEAEIADFPVATDYGAYADIRIFSDDGPALKARAYIFDEPEALRPGDRVRMTAKLERADRVGEREITGYTSKGYFLFTSDARDIQLLSSPGMGPGNFHKYLAKAIRDKIREIFPLGTEGFMLALLTGDRTELDRDVALTTAMARSGISHIVAVS